MKIAVIGSGIAGNTLVWRLGGNHNLTVYEAGDYLGGHTHTHSLSIDGFDLEVDSGFIVFNEKTYPNFIGMLDQLGVEKQNTSMSFSVHCEQSGLEYCGTSLNSLFAQRTNLVRPRFYQLLGDILRFNRESLALLQSEDRALTLGDYLATGGYSEMFKRYYILPMGAAIWSQDLISMLEFPARFFVQFFHNHGLLSVKNRPRWFVVKGGSKTYVEKIYEGFEGRIRLKTPVTRVVRHRDRVDIYSRNSEGAHRDSYDAVFFACHADQALAMIADPSPLEKDTLSRLPYQKNRAVLHTGNELLPRRPNAWASWNYRIPQAEKAAATVTYHMNRLQSLPVATDVCVTLNPVEEIPASRILAEMSYDHPVFTLDGIEAQGRQKEINGHHRSFFCGAYWRYGFHEDGVVSALNAIDDFNQWVRRHEDLPLRRTG